MRLAATTIVLALSVATGIASAEPGDIARFRTGDDLYRDCMTASSQQVCFAYIEGIADAMGCGDRVFGQRVCVPAKAESQQLKNAVMVLLQAHPESRGAAAADLVALALADAFPCRAAH
jgi:hypothetical protein